MCGVTPRLLLIGLAIVVIVLGVVARDSAFMHALGTLGLAVANLVWTLVSLPFRIAGVFVQHLLAR